MKLDLKQVLLYAIVPALIAGFFSVAPKAYEIIFETKAALEYSMSTGPQITTEGTVQQVVSVKVANSGKKPLTAISAELSVPGATLLAYSVENNSGLSIEQEKSDTNVLVRLPKALPDETFLISALVRSTTPTITPRFVVRSDEVLGKPAEPSTIKNELRLTALSAGGAAFSVLAMAIFGLRKVQNAVMPSKRTAIMYIALAFRDESLMEAVQREGAEITYMQFADMLLAYGRSSDQKRKQAIAGLKCLRSIERMATASQSVVARNLKILVGPNASPEVDDPSKRILLTDSDSLEFREYVDEVFSINSTTTQVPS